LLSDVLKILDVAVHKVKITTETRIDKPLGKDFLIRASGSYDICPRYEVLRNWNNIDEKDVFSAQAKISMGIGNTVHDLVKAGVFDVAWGKWIFEKEGKVIYEEGKVTRSIEHIVYGSDTEWVQRNSAIKAIDNNLEKPMDIDRLKQRIGYEEIYFMDKKLRVHGHPDIIIGDGKPQVVVEIKTIAPFKFASVLSSPLPEHVLQLKIYLHLAKQLYSNIDKGVLYYVCIDEKRQFPTKEWDVNYDSGAIADFAKVTGSIYKGLTEKVLPEKICMRADVPRAISCVARDKCFEIKD
jgi:CRISPR/Cas system-associated exonuclease Cas4 (RecB family)